MRSLVDDDIHLLPQWSDPKPLTLSTLPPPEINSSTLLSISVTSPSDSDSFSVSTTVELSWKEPEETDDLEMYEVWVGGRALGEFEQTEENEVLGSILQFQVPYVIREYVLKCANSSYFKGSYINDLLTYNLCI